MWSPMQSSPEHLGLHCCGTTQNQSCNIYWCCTPCYCDVWVLQI